MKIEPLKARFVKCCLILAALFLSGFFFFFLNKKLKLFGLPFKQPAFFSECSCFRDVGVQAGDVGWRQGRTVWNLRGLR